jgi:hypothetical protein
MPAGGGIHRISSVGVKSIITPHHTIYSQHMFWPSGMWTVPVPRSDPFPAPDTKDAAENRPREISKKITPARFSAKEWLNDFNQTTIGAHTQNNWPNKSGVHDRQWERQCRKSKYVMQFV